MYIVVYIIDTSCTKLKRYLETNNHLGTGMIVSCLPNGDAIFPTGTTCTVPMDHTRKQTMIICPKSNRGIGILHWFAKIDKKEDHQFIVGNEPIEIYQEFFTIRMVRPKYHWHSEWLANIRFAWLSLPDFVLQTCIYPVPSGKLT